MTLDRRGDAVHEPRTRREHVPAVYRMAGTGRGVGLEYAAMPLDLFAGIPITDYATALEWYERLFGSPPSFVPNESEAVWELAEHRFVFIEQHPERAGHARHLVFVDNLDALVAQVAERGLVPAQRETLSNGVRKVTYRDPDGNLCGFGGAPL